jgi:hypothetical protein
MAPNNGKDIVPFTLAITGIKELVVWIADDVDKRPMGWMAGVSIAELIPDPFKGFKYRYTKELIAPYKHTGVC